jgi:hypothetical protein
MLKAANEREDVLVNQEVTTLVKDEIDLKLEQEQNM